MTEISHGRDLRYANVSLCKFLLNKCFTFISFKRLVITNIIAEMSTTKRLLLTGSYRLNLTTTRMANRDSVPE